MRNATEEVSQAFEQSAGLGSLLADVATLIERDPLGYDATELGHLTAQLSEIRERFQAGAAYCDDGIAACLQHYNERARQAA